MKLSTRLGLIVGCAALGALVLVFVALQTIHSSIVDERKAQLRSMINLTVKQVGVYVALEKAGTLSRDEAQAQAKQAMAGLRDGDDYVFVRDMKGTTLVHPDRRKEGVIDMGATMPDGRTLMQVYLDALKTGDQVQVEILTKRPKGDKLVAKINGLGRIPEWDWIVGYGVFIDDVEGMIRSLAASCTIKHRYPDN